MDRQERGANLHAGTAEAAGAQPPSPAHEFSFTISLHPTLPAGDTENKPTPPAAVDLSPAGDIFFHGHLLPLHPHSHLPSANSMDSSALPAKESPQQWACQADPNRSRATCSSTATSRERSLPEGGGGVKSRSFSLFWLPKWGKLCEKRCPEGQNRRSKFDMSHFLRKYMRLIKPFVSRGDRDARIRRQTYSFSRNLNFRSRLMGRRQFSAPASMGNSPRNSGLLMASGNLRPTKNPSPSDSTMEDLQAAIQAAIAHCKNSMAEDQHKLP